MATKRPGISGTWRDTQQFYSVYSPLHVADPRHGQVGHEEDRNDVAFQSPPYPYMPPQGREDFGSQEVPDIRGLQIDRTPDTHDPDIRWGLDYTTTDEIDVPGGPDADILAWTNAVHAKDAGAHRKQNYSEKTLQFSDEKYLFFRVPGLGSEATDGIPALSGGGQRGLNAYSVNNPPLESYWGHGFWPGHTEQAVVDRKLYTRVIQRHDERANTLNLPYFEKNTPPAKDHVNSPFSGLQRMIGSVSKIALRRQTPPNPGDIAEEVASPDMESPTVEAAFYG